jgi:Uri superfamily endonuclease
MPEGVNPHRGLKPLATKSPGGLQRAQNETMLPAEPGTYVVVLRSSSTRTIRIGRLGTLALRPGYYVYIGSAFGPGGLRARIAHHARRAAFPHWHIDYLRRHTRLEAVCYCCGERREHEFAAAIGALPGAAVPLPGFGSSDCRCETHLFWFADGLCGTSKPRSE